MVFTDAIERIRYSVRIKYVKVMKIQTSIKYSCRKFLWKFKST